MSLRIKPTSIAANEIIEVIKTHIELNKDLSWDKLYSELIKLGISTTKTRTEEWERVMGKATNTWEF